jgi:hypothetical protein
MNNKLGLLINTYLKISTHVVLKCNIILLYEDKNLYKRLKLASLDVITYP